MNRETKQNGEKPVYHTGRSYAGAANFQDAACGNGKDRSGGGKTNK